LPSKFAYAKIQDGGRCHFEISYWVVILPCEQIRTKFDTETETEVLVLDQVLPAKLISQKMTDGGSAILKFKLSTATGPLLHISPYAAKMPFIVIKQQILM